MGYEEIEREVKKVLSEKRFNHSVCVAKKAAELALKYGEDVETAKIIGVTHDIAKETKINDFFKYVENNNIQIDEVEKRNPKLLHAKVGADICKNKFGFNKQMQDAIKYHTTGHIDMDNMAKIIYLADKIEEGRSYDALELAREKADISLDEGMFVLLSEGIKKSIDSRKSIHLDSVNLYNKLTSLVNS